LAEQLKLALDGITALTKALQGTRRLVANALSSLSTEDTPLPKVARAVGDLEKAPDNVRRAIPELDQAVGAARERLGQLQSHRRDVVRRRDQLAAAAREKGIPYRFTDAADYLGPFRLEHSETAMVIRLGKLAIGRISTPSGREALGSMLLAEAKLQRGALEGWDNFVGALQRKQDELGGSEPVQWRRLLEAAVPDSKMRRRLAAVLLYRLALLVSPGAPGNWRFSLTPPTLAEQRTAIEVPDLRHPGEPIRVARGRLSQL
jgi:hypothetical protein